MRYRDAGREQAGLTCLGQRAGKGITGSLFDQLWEFDYAKRAIQLGSFDYYLKPIDYKKLHDILEKAAEKVTVEEEIRRNSILGQYWISLEGERKANFWNDIVCDRMEQTPETIRESAEKLRLSYDLTQNFIMLAIHLNPKTQADWRDDGMVCYQLTDTYMECLGGTEKVSMEALWKRCVFCLRL